MLGIKRLFDSADAFKNNITFFVTMFYLVIFGVLIVLSELNVYAIVKHFGFMFSYRGAGLFYIYSGTLVLGVNIQDVDFPIGLVVGITIIVIGIINLIVSCFLSKPVKPAYVKHDV